MKKFSEFINEGTTPQFKKLIKRAKQEGIETQKELYDLIDDEFGGENDTISGADFEEAKKVLRITEAADRSKELSYAQKSIDKLLKQNEELDAELQKDIAKLEKEIQALKDKCLKQKEYNIVLIGREQADIDAGRHNY